MGAWWCRAVVIGLIGCLPASASAFSLDGADTGADGQTGAVQLTADRVDYNRDEDRITATGGVRVDRGSTRMTVDRLDWWRLRGALHAKGHVEVVDGDNHLSANAVTWNLADNTGDIIDGELTLDGRYHLSGSLISRVAEDRYEVEDGNFSTCSCGHNGVRAWSVTAKHLRLQAQGTLVARRVAFRVRNVPVLYLPIFVFPTASRQTGLLIPKFGSDTRNGIRYEQPFYWNISPSKDLTLTYNLRSRLGQGGEALYRYMTGPRGHGELRVDGLHNRDTGTLQGELSWHHDTLRERGWNWHADINLVADRNHFRDLEDDAESRTRESVASNLFASRLWDNSALTLLARNVTNLNGADGSTVQHLPRVRAEAFTRRVADLPLWWGGHVDMTNLSRRVGESAVRVDAAPKVSFRVQPLGGRLTAVASAGARWLWYSAGPNDSGGSMGESYPLTASVSGRLLGSLAGKPHLIVPQLIYRKVTVNRANAAEFDLLEQSHDEHELALWLKQRWGQVNWRLGAAYDLADRAPLPVRSALQRASANTVVSLDSLHQPENGRLLKAEADAAWVRDWGQLSLGALFDRGTTGVGTPFSADTLLAPADGQAGNFQTVGVMLGPWRGWSLSQNSHYDWADGALVEARYGLAYSSSCWSLAFNYVDLPDRNVLTFRIALIGPDGPGSPLAVSRHPLLGGS